MTHRQVSGAGANRRIRVRHSQRTVQGATEHNIHYTKLMNRYRSSQLYGRTIGSLQTYGTTALRESLLGPLGDYLSYLGQPELVDPLRRVAILESGENSLIELRSPPEILLASTRARRSTQGRTDLEV